MLISPEEKKALRRLQADKMLTKKELANMVGVNRKTLASIVNDDKPQKIHVLTYQKIMRAIVKSY